MSKLKRIFIWTILPLTAIAAACTPQQVAVFNQLSPEDQHKVLTQIQEGMAQRAPADRFAHVLSDAGLARLRTCESGGNYRAVSASGTYRGAYQFSRTTWNSVAAKFYPHLRGVDPAAAPAYEQDRMARALWANGGPGHWPVCGKRV